jgi:hypothetical protein
VCPSIFGETGGQEGEPPHKGHATALRLSAPSSSLYPAVKKANRCARSIQPPRCTPPQLRCNWRSNTRAQAHKSCNRRASYWVQKNCTVACANATSSWGCSGSFSEPVQRLVAPRAWPNSDIKYDDHVPVSRGNKQGTRHDHRQAGGNYINRRTGAVSQPPIGLWPHLQTHILL